MSTEEEAVRPSDLERAVARVLCMVDGSDFDLIVRERADGPTATLVARLVVDAVEADCERRVAQAREGYWPANNVLEELRTETDFYEGKVGGSQEKQDGYALGFYEAADFLERRFSGEGTS